jgi:hypothetical protein
MERNFDAQNLINLPQMNGSGAVALGESLNSAAKAQKKLPKQLADSLKKVVDTTDAVQKALSARLPPPVGDADLRPADYAEDNAWSALSEFLSGWARLPETFADAEMARQLKAEIFPDGLKFLLLPYKEEWAESEARLQRMRQGKAAASIKQLGGATFLDHLNSTHAAYGKALGITQQKAAGPAPVSMRDPLEAFTKAVRGYALKVAAYADEDDPATQKLAAALLEPLASWQSKQPQSAQPKADPKPTDPTPTK